LRKVVLVLSLSLLAFAPAAAGTAEKGPRKNPGEPKAVPGELIVAFRAGVSEAEQAAALGAAGAKAERKLGKAGLKLAKADPERLVRVLKRLEGDLRVAYAEENYLLYADAVVPDDPSFGQLWGLRNTGQTGGTADADIDADEAWSVTTGSPDAVVAVVDTGVDYTHPDLSANIWTNPGEVPGNGADDDANGYVDDIRGYDFFGGDANPQDDNDHGTHVAGTIAAVGSNGVGITGVSWRARIMPLKFLGANGSGDTADAVDAIRYATANGARVINASWGGGGYSQALADAIEDADRAGVLFVAAAGNASTDIDSSPTYPASYQTVGLIAVAASDANDEGSSFSNVGRRSVDLAAPGSAIYSTVPGGYDTFDGTSMASPHVAGAAALALAASPSASPAGLKALLLRTADPLSSPGFYTASDGRLNAGRALECAGAPQAWLEQPGPSFDATVGVPLEIAAVGAACGDPAAASLTVTANGGPVTLAARGDGVYAGTWTPTADGPVTIVAAASAGAVTDSVSVSGDAFENYREVVEPFAWVDATAGGTRLSLGDDSSTTIPLPFDASLYRTAYTSMNVSSNGYVSFEDNAKEWRNRSIPDATLPNAIVAPYWDDLDPSVGGAVWTRTVGEAPNRRFVVAWVGVPRFTGGDATFELILEEGTGDFVFQYQDVVHGDPDWDYGGGATIGVEDGAGERGTLLSYNDPYLAGYESTKAIRLTVGEPPPPPPPDTTPPAAPTGLTAAASDGRVTVEWDDVVDAAGYWVYRDGVRVAETSTSGHVDDGRTNGVTYTYRVTAFDAARNESTPSAEVSATPTGASIRTYQPNAYTILIGTLYGGTLSSLFDDDGNRLQIKAQSSGGQRVADMYASATVERAGLRRLEIAYDGKTNKSNASVTLYVYDWSAGAWEAVDGPRTGVTSDRAFTWTETASTASYVSAGGEVRFRVRGTRSLGFRLQADLVRFTTET
jgi:subtilisin family serine protease